MLDIFKLKNKTNNKKYIQEFNDYLWNTRHAPSANREWKNSIFCFNSKNRLLLPSLDITITKIIKSYFTMYRYYMEKKVKLPFIKKWKRRFKIRRFWIDKGDIKHTNDKVIITLYIYNGQYNKLLRHLKRLKLKIFSKKKEIKSKYNKYKKLISYLSKVNKKIQTKLYKKNLDINVYYLNILKKIIKKSLRKEILYLRYKQIILLNKQKFTNNLLLPLKKLLIKLYNKKVEFNIISLKNFYLNSNIMSQILLTKIRRNRRRTLRILGSLKAKVKTPVLNNRVFLKEKNSVIGIDNEKISKFLLNNINNSIDKINMFLRKTFIPQKTLSIKHSNNKENLILNEIKHKILSGVRVQASGRLTRRIIAARSISKLTYKGSLRNVDSTYKGLSTVMLRGNSKSNVQYTLLKSRTRIGSFGLKGWISGY